MSDNNIPEVPSTQDQIEKSKLHLLSQSEIERLGRQRPEIFKTAWAEFGFCFSLLTSMLVAEYFISGFNILLPVLAVDLKIPSESQTWPASVFSLVTGAFLLPFGRMADIFGGHVLFVGGLVWFFIWSLIAGFSQNYVMLNFCRALQGFGPAAFLPSGIMLLGSIYRPGPRKNLVFSLYGAFAPIGFFAGIFIGGVSGEFLSWGWFFWIGTILLFIISVVAFMTVPAPTSSNPTEKVEMDWWGAITIVPGLLLVVYSITDSSHAANGWASPEIFVTFIIGVLFLCAAIYVEGWVAKAPLLPFDLFQIKYLTPLILSLFLTYGVFGVYLYYASFYIQTVLNVSSLLSVAWFAPMAVGGLVLALTGGFTLHLLPGKVLLVTAGLGSIASVLLFALIPADPNYWAFVFPAMLCATLGVDITFSVSNVFITTSLPAHRQGLAGALINSLIFLGISFFLALADLVVSSKAHLGVRESYKTAFWFAVGCSCTSLFLMVGFVKLGRANSELTSDEKAELEAEMLRT